MTAFAGLLLAKGFISGLYLHHESGPFSGASLALAEEKSEPVALGGNSEEALKRKEIALKEKEIALKKMEEGLLPLKKEIEQKIEELNELQTRLATFSRELAERENALNDAKVAHLVALYTAMDPAKAAGIMDKLNIDTVVRILRSMKGKSAGQILASMDAAKGATISEKLSKQD